MKRISAIVIAIVVAACTDSPAAPVDDRGVGPAFEATSNVYNVMEPFQLDVFVDCAAGGAGEVVKLEGTLHTMVVWTVDAQGGVHAMFHDQPQGVSGYGMTTGLKYQGTGMTQDMGWFAAAGFPAEFSYINNYRIIGQGAGNNILIHDTQHYTINANGDVTADVVSGTSECR